MRWAIFDFRFSPVSKPISEENVVWVDFSPFVSTMIWLRVNWLNTIPDINFSQCVPISKTFYKISLFLIMRAEMIFFLAGKVFSKQEQIFCPWQEFLNNTWRAYEWLSYRNDDF
jgi:hypothetical protein